MVNIVNKITVDDLYQRHGELLNLQWIAGRQGGQRVVVPEIVYPPQAPAVSDDREAIAKTTRRDHIGKSLVGYLNLIHPHQVQLLGKVELDFLHKLRDITQEDTLREIYAHQPVCMIITDDCQAPEVLVHKCNQTNVPLFKTATVSARVSDTLRYFLTNMFADVVTVHGVFMEVMGIGVLISGPSAAGKSELALELITRGHRLIADDAPEFSKIAPDIVRGSCPHALMDFLEVRGLGIINVRRLYGENAVKKEKYLRLIIRLERMQTEALNTLDRLGGSYRQARLFDLDIPEITLPVAPGRNMAILVESAVRNHVLRMSGYDSSRDFIDHQQRLVKGRSEG